MKIAVDCRMTGMSGIGVYLDNILRYFISANVDDQYLLVGSRKKLSVYVNNQSCEILDTDVPIFSLKEFFGFPVKEINKCDLFYSPNFNIPYGIKVPIFSTIHDVVFLDVNGLTSGIGKFIRRCLLKRTVRISKMLFTVSAFSRQRIMYHFPDAPEIIVANSGINHMLMEYKPCELSPYPFEYILFIGNIKKHKGLEILLNAFDNARGKGFDRKLLIVGDHENFRTADKKILRRLDEQDKNIIFTGRITDEQLYDTIAHSSLLVQPSVYEGFGLPPLESLYLGCNALISDIPVFHEIYGSLPVTYFDLNDINDLENKIISCVNNEKLPESVRFDIDKLYSLSRTSELILSHIKNNKNEKFNKKSDK